MDSYFYAPDETLSVTWGYKSVRTSLWGALKVGQSRKHEVSCTALSLCTQKLRTQASKTLYGKSKIPNSKFTTSPTSCQSPLNLPLLLWRLEMSKSDPTSPTLNHLTIPQPSPPPPTNVCFSHSFCVPVNSNPITLTAWAVLEVIPACLMSKQCRPTASSYSCTATTATAALVTFTWMVTIASCHCCFSCYSPAHSPHSSLSGLVDRPLHLTLPLACRLSVILSHEMCGLPCGRWSSYEACVLGSPWLNLLSY